MLLSFDTVYGKESIVVDNITYMGYFKDRIVIYFNHDLAEQFTLHFKNNEEAKAAHDKIVLAMTSIGY